MAGGSEPTATLLVGSRHDGAMPSPQTVPLAQLAPVVLGLSESDRANALLCRVMAVTGFGGRRDGEAVLVFPDPQQQGRFVVEGSLLGGSVDDLLVQEAGLAASGANTSLVSVPIGDAIAVSAGLACGGVADILLERLDCIPRAFWESVASRSRIGLVSPLPTAGQNPTEPTETSRKCFAVIEGLSIALPEDAANAVWHQLHKGTVRAQIIEVEGSRWFCEVVSPMPHVGVIGVSGLATAIANQASLLGWTTTVIDERSDTGLEDSLAIARSLGTTDALVVLSHDLVVSCGALHAAANESLGNPYLGALGSRHTQSA
jgi:xanthine dehydrogenase accessory factor